VQKEIATFHPDCIGISLRNVDNASYPATRFYLPSYSALVKSIRKISKVPVILGGSAFSLFPDEIAAYLEADGGIRGEGENAAEIFQEFKKGLEKELGDQDSETHYNLGIAYKEMGLLDDAIKEFQTAKEDPARSFQSASMLGVCYMEKGLYQLAIDVLNIAVKNIDIKDESYWAIKYDLADAYEKNNNFKEALDLFTEVYGWNAKYRNVTEKMSHVRALNLKGRAGDKTRERKDRVSYL